MKSLNLSGRLTFPCAKFEPRLALVCALKLGFKTGTQFWPSLGGRPKLAIKLVNFILKWIFKIGANWALFYTLDSSLAQAKVNIPLDLKLGITYGPTSKYANQARGKLVQIFELNFRLGPLSSQYKIPPQNIYIQSKIPISQTLTKNNLQNERFTDLRENEEIRQSFFRISRQWILWIIGIDFLFVWKLR